MNGKRFVVAMISGLILALAVPMTASAQVCSLASQVKPVKKKFKNKWGNQVEVEVQYLNTSGHTSVDGSGIYYHIDGHATQKGSLYYPAVYWYDAYPLYLMAHTMTFRVIIKNKRKRPLRNLRVLAVQEYLNFHGKDGVDFDGCPITEWYVKKIPALTKWTGEVTVYIPPRGNPGLDQTHVQIQEHVEGCVKKKTKLLWDKPQAGIFCPPEFDD